jgi:PHD/YefM family antitoxin component YafN of YafNO toxin-antitoxin module
MRPDVAGGVQFAWETAYLMRLPTNAKRLMNAIESFKAGG